MKCADCGTPLLSEQENCPYCSTSHIHTMTKLDHISSSDDLNVFEAHTSILPESLPQTPQPSWNNTLLQMKRNEKLAFGAGIIGFIVLLIGVGLIIMIVFALKNPFHATGQLEPKPTLEPAISGPSGQKVVAMAADIVIDPETSAQIDNNYNPTEKTKTFTTKQTVYLVFGIESQTKNGYIEAIWYKNNQLVSKDSFEHMSNNLLGYFSTTYEDPGDGTVELYWCTQANCSDAQLAQVVQFTITAPKSAIQKQLDLSY